MWFAALFTGKNGSLLRTVIIVSIILTVVILLYFFVKSKIKKSAVDKIQQAKVEEFETEVITDKLSFPLSEYNNMAQKIEDSKGFFNDDEEAVYEVFQRLKTNSDVLKLQEVFGIRDDKDLFGYLRNFLNNDELQKINDILAQRNISIKI